MNPVCCGQGCLTKGELGLVEGGGGIGAPMTSELIPRGSRGGVGTIVVPALFERWRLTVADWACERRFRRAQLPLWDQPDPH